VGVIGFYIAGKIPDGRSQTYEAESSMVILVLNGRRNLDLVPWRMRMLLRFPSVLTKVLGAYICNLMARG
jgi:hypothetical protein